jgi:hypothetical protein
MLLRWVSLAVLAVCLVWVALADVTYPVPPTHFPGLRGAIYVLLGVQGVLLIMLFWFTACSMHGWRATSIAVFRGIGRALLWPFRLIVRLVRGPRGGPLPPGDGFTPTLQGFAGPFVALIGWLAGGGLSIGVGLWTAQVLGHAVLSTAAARDQIERRAAILANGGASFEDKVNAFNADAPLIVPPPYFWGAVANVVLIIVAALTGLGVWWWIVRRRARSELRWVLADYPAAAANDPRARQVASSRAWAALTDLVAPIVARLALFAVAEIVVLLVFYLAKRYGFESLPASSPAITNVSVFITVALATLLVGLAVLAFRDRQLRRVVAVLWDVITFWPRANHPLTPPCYAQRTVPELLARLQALTDDGAGDSPLTRVVLAAHSQGSIIGAATLLQADHDTAQRVALLTFGSPLRRLYARNFPAYFGTGAIPRLRQRQRPRWINLWARSDPIGSWVIDDRDRSMEAALTDVDYRLLDVESLTPRPDGTYPPICGHSGFWTRPEYRDAMTALESNLLPAGTAPEPNVNICPTEGRL